VARWIKVSLLAAGVLLALAAATFWHYMRLVPVEALKEVARARAACNAAPGDQKLRLDVVAADLLVVEKSYEHDESGRIVRLRRAGLRYLREAEELLNETPTQYRNLRYTRLLGSLYCAEARIPGSDPALFDKAAGIFSQALKQYEPSQVGNPELTEVARMLGMLCVTRARDTEAAQAFYKAVTLDPNDADTHFRYGFTLARLDNRAAGPLMRQAASEYERSLAIDPNQGEVWYYLGFAHMRLKDKPSAITAFQKAKDLGYKEAEDALSKLGT
jgi:predicted Zn-dependent protease